MADDTPKKTKKSKQKVAETEPTNADEETPIFNPREGLTEDQLALRDQLEALALEYAQDDAEKAWLST